MDDTQEKPAVPSPRSAARRRRRRVAGWIVLLALATVLVPPFINIGRFKSRIAQAISTSLGRPVRLSSAELRLFPWPSFVLTNLSVAEDPAYGSEPVLHADSVRANLRLWALWRGRIEFSSINVDSASLNLVRAAPGRWNFGSLFRTAAAQPGSALRTGRLPYLEATDSRINIKDGIEKLPFSLINADLSFWQESPGDWRVRLRGQPARTDVALELGDTGTVRLEASLRRTAKLSEMPVRLDLDWREAQLGALARLLTGSDPGWRGDLTGEAHVDGTPDAAQVRLRLSATGVHRAEFAPPVSLDFDANCGFIYDYAARALSKLDCDSPLGDGRLHISGELAGSGSSALTLEMDRIPAGAGLDLLRTLRSGIAPSLEAAGTVSGKLQYIAAPEGERAAESEKRGKLTLPDSPAPSQLAGNLTVRGFSLRGGALSQPLRVSRVVLAPAEGGAPGGGETIAGSATVAAGGPTPLNVSLHFGAGGYQMALRGPVSLARARELAQTAGTAGAAALKDVAGEPALLNLTARGRWIPADEFTAGAQPTDGDQPAGDSLAGTVALHGVNWRADFLASHVSISEAVLHVSRDQLVWDPVEFTYGPLKGTAILTIPANCPAAGGAAAKPGTCEPFFELNFGSLDAAELQSAFLGAPRKGTLLDSLIDRFHSNTAPAWPKLQGTIAANRLALGPVTIRRGSAEVKISAQSANISEFAGQVLGGELHGSATVNWAGGAGNEPSYAIDADAKGIAAAAAGQLLGTHWAGGPMNLEARLELSGFKGASLARSAKGTVRFQWRHGAVTAQEGGESAGSAPAAGKTLMRFDEWSGEAQIADGAAKLGTNEAVRAGRRETFAGGVTLSNPPKVQLAAARPVKH